MSSRPPISSRISEVNTQLNASWKIVSDASDAALIDAAVRIAEEGATRRF